MNLGGIINLKIYMLHFHTAFLDASDLKKNGVKLAVYLPISIQLTSHKYKLKNLMGDLWLVLSFCRTLRVTSL